VALDGDDPAAVATLERLHQAAGTTGRPAHGAQARGQSGLADGLMVVRVDHQLDRVVVFVGGGQPSGAPAASARARRLFGSISMSWVWAGPWP